jgi:hypothetical protein
MRCVTGDSAPIPGATSNCRETTGGSPGRWPRRGRYLSRRGWSSRQTLRRGFPKVVPSLLLFPVVGPTARPAT